MNKLLLIDGNSLINRAYFALPPLNDSEGNNVNAVYGFVNLMLSAITTYNPTHLIVAFDAGGKNFRKEIYSEYKANRTGMPSDLATQMPVLIKLLETMNVKIVMDKGVEADDIIGTLCNTIDMPNVIVTGDRDMLQLIDDNTTVALTRKGIQDVELVDQDGLLESYHMTPSQVVEYKSLRGDTSDNIPGVKGIGDKTAMSLLSQYHDLDGVYANLDGIKGALRDKLVEGKELAYTSRRLATIVTDLPIKCPIEQCNLPMYNQKVKNMMIQLKFRSIVSRLTFLEESTTGQSAVAQQRVVESTDITSIAQLQLLIDSISDDSEIAIDISDNIVSVAMVDTCSYNIAVSDSFIDELTMDKVLYMLSPILASNTVNKVVFDGKQLRHYLAQYSVELNAVKYDLALMQYLALQRSCKNIGELYNELNLGNSVACMLTAKTSLYQQLETIGNVSLYFDVELPLSNVLYDMERCGVKVDTRELGSMSVEMQKQLQQLSEQIWQQAGQQFNISSPKQLASILFDKLNLQHFKKTATGYSTNNDVLTKLLGTHPIIELIMQYRQISKLYGTYVEGLKPLIVEGRLHTTYNQYLTTTGRLSSSEPNLQNIPIRTDMGKNIRKLFVPSLDMFVGADYSQIELRLLAAFSHDINLIDAFVNKQDIHARVASELMGVPLAMVNSNMRRMAKAVNFGIIYGISDFGLSENIGLTIGKAHKYIQLYFERFPTIKSYLDGCIAYARDNGYVTTILGRRRYIPEINSANFNLRSFGERAAMNMPLQGSAADIMKVAMIEVAEQLKSRRLKSKLVLQIHDEIIIDTHSEEIEQVKQIITDAMNRSTELACPIVADIEEGGNLYEV